MTTTTSTQISAADGVLAASPAPDRAGLPHDRAALPYHRLALANPRHRWWRPLLTALLAGAAYLVLTVLAYGVIGVTALVAPQTVPLLSFDELSTSNPTGMLIALGLVALMLPAALIGVRLGEGRPVGTLSSVAGRLRWGRLGRALGLAVGIMMAVHLPFLLLTGSRPSWSATSLAMIALALLVVPFQAAAEEYVFRALPQQVLGAWLRSPWWGILLPVPFFISGHVYDAPGLVAVGVFALVAGVLTWRTGGLEAAIGLHVANNALLLVFGAFGMGDPGAADTTWIAASASVLVDVVYTVVVLRWMRDAD